jgi:hypothetical protein
MEETGKIEDRLYACRWRRNTSARKLFDILQMGMALSWHEGENRNRNNSG